MITEQHAIQCNRCGYTIFYDQAYIVWPATWDRKPEFTHLLCERQNDAPQE